MLIVDLKNPRFGLAGPGKQKEGEMQDTMLSELYKRAFAEKAICEGFNGDDGSENSDRLRQVALAKNRLLSELIDIRTDQIRRGEA